MKNIEIPDSRKVLELPSYHSNLARALLSLRISSRPVIIPGHGQVLIKVDASPCNPSDIAFLRGMYNIKRSIPAIPGFEGTGRIIAAGNDDLTQKLSGRRVSFFTQEDQGGAWAEYVTISLDNCIFVADELPTDQAACFAVNPFTAWALFSMVKQRGHKAIIQNAATGQVGRFISTFARLDGIPVINLVRKDEHAELLIKQGEVYVLNVKDENFAESILQLVRETGAGVFIDAVGGEITGMLFNILPPDSEVIVYGGLSGLPISQIDTMEVIFKNKVLRGFNLDDWLRDLSGNEFLTVSGKLQDMIIQQRIGTKIQGSFPLDHYNEALRAYISNMSGGKIIFTM